ncbi:MAG: FTR1 family protein [Lutibacter sp.]|nr:FTR1 family protein [Lutibacter sp.]
MITRKLYHIFLLICLLTSLSPNKVSAKNNDNKEIQTIIHLLDYISKDYPMVIKEGLVLNEKEYEEMQEFSATVYDLTDKITLPPKERALILSNLLNLQKLIENKESFLKIDAITKFVKEEIIKITGYITAPTVWPDSNSGQKLFAQNCIQCHGSQGDGNGELAVGLNPIPTNFLNDSLMEKVSPFQEYNTIRLGVKGTAMEGFTKFTDKEIWNLAFYVKSLRFKKQPLDSILFKSLLEQANLEVSLEDVATLSDIQLMEKLGTSSDDNKTKNKLKALRIFSQTENPSDNSLKIATDYLISALKTYKEGENKTARRYALAAYLEGIEPMEAKLKTYAPAFSTKLEQQMLRVRQSIEQNKNNSEVENEINVALGLIVEANQVMKDSSLSYWLTFLLSASILLREGLEAFLIIVLILALIRSSGAKQAKIWVHSGWILAVAMGMAGWFLSGWLINISGQNREIMEGLISLFAVIILSFVGFWLHNNSHAEKWKKFVEEKIGKQLQKEKMFGLAFFSFMVVFREAFESILFLQAINLETIPINKSAIGFGVLAAFGLIALLGFLFLRYSKKIPVRQLFLYSSWGISLLAIILLGKGIHSIQESGWISITNFPIVVHVDWLGIYPTTETIVSQLILLGVVLALYYSNSRKWKLHSNSNR